MLHHPLVFNVFLGHLKKTPFRHVTSIQATIPYTLSRICISYNKERLKSSKDNIHTLLVFTIRCNYMGWAGMVRSCTQNGLPFTPRWMIVKGFYLLPCSTTLGTLSLPAFVLRIHTFISAPKAMCILVSRFVES